MGSIPTLATLPLQGVDVVARLHGARKPDFRQATQRWGRQDGLFAWGKGYQRSALLSPRQWRLWSRTVLS